MKRAHLDDMVRGWFVGDFEPTLLATQDVEVGVKRFAQGDLEERHHHRIATEISAVVSGELRMNDERLSAGDIIVMEPGESTDFEALTDVTLVVVKVPGAKDDKYLG